MGWVQEGEAPVVARVRALEEALGGAGPSTQEVGSVACMYTLHVLSMPVLNSSVHPACIDYACIE